MTKEEKLKLKTAVTGLFKAFNAPVPDKAGLAFWLSTLNEKPYGLVRDALLDWAKTGTFVPRPGEILQKVEAVEAAARLKQKEKERAEAEAKAPKEPLYQVDAAAELGKAMAKIKDDDSGSGNFYVDRARKWLGEGIDQQPEEFRFVRAWWAKCVTEGK